MLEKFLKEYQDNNTEKFNDDFIIKSREKSILPYVKEIFKSLEALDEIEILSVTLENDESGFEPIIHEGKMYKSVLPTRLEKIHYKIKVTPNEKPLYSPVFDSKEKLKTITADSFIIEKDLYINKLIDGLFYINEGCRYFLVHQLVNAVTYGSKNSISLKSLLMPITLSKKTDIGISLTSVDGTEVFNGIPVYELALFKKRVNPLLYVFGAYSHNDLVLLDPTPESTTSTAKSERTNPDILKKFNEFFGIDFKYSNSTEELKDPSRVIFQISDQAFVSVNREKLKDRDEITLAVLGCLTTIRPFNKKRKTSFSYTEMTMPMFWIQILSSYFTKSNDICKKFEKVRTMLISLERLMDDATRRTLRIPDEDKINSLTIIRYMLKNFQALSREDNNDMANLRIRLYEYNLMPLRVYFSEQIYRILNSPTHSRVVLEKAFSNLKPFYLVRQTVVSELLRYYNGTNEMDLITAALVYTKTGPQAIQKVVSNETRDIHPSEIGKISLVASNASNPGLSGRLTPFVKVYDYGYFTEE